MKFLQPGLAFYGEIKTKCATKKSSWDFSMSVEEKALSY